MIRSYEEPPSAAAALLQLARMKAGLSQRELAERAGVPPTMISAYERDKRQPSLATLLRLIEATGFELHMQLAHRDPHDDVLAALESERSPAEGAERDRQIEVWRRATPTQLADIVSAREAVGRQEDVRALPALYRLLATERLSSRDN